MEDSGHSTWWSSSLLNYLVRSDLCHSQAKVSVDHLNLKGLVPARSLFFLIPKSYNIVSFKSTSRIWPRIIKMTTWKKL